MEDRLSRKPPPLSCPVPNVPHELLPLSEPPPLHRAPHCLTDGVSPTPQVSARLTAGDSTCPPTSACLSEGVRPTPQVSARLTACDSTCPPASACLSDGVSPTPQVSARLTAGDSTCPPASACLSDGVSPTPQLSARLTAGDSTCPPASDGPLTQTLKDLRASCGRIAHPDLPPFEFVPNETADSSLWKKSDQTNAQVLSHIDEAYEQVVYFKQNLMLLPSGAVTKQLVTELAFWLKQINEPSSSLNAHALKAFMVIPDLLLQKPTRRAKAKDNSEALKRRLLDWSKGNIQGLLKEAKQIQQKLDAYHKAHRSNEARAKTFAALICDGKVNAAMKMLDDDASGGLLPLTPDVIHQLQEKHPKTCPILESSEALLHGPVERPETYLYDGIDELCIQRAALKTKGSAGPSGMHADLFRSILCSNKHHAESKELREQIALLTRRLSTTVFDPSLLEALVSCRLVPLDKKPGVRPIGVGETLRRIMGKAVSWVLKEEIKTAAGPLQTCASHGAGAEAAIHGMREIYERDDTEAVLLIDASNAFNRLNRAAALHNVQVLCPSLAKYIINT